MKKILALVLILCMLAPAALADTLTVDLDTASMEELQTAQSAISDRISELRAASAPAQEDIMLSGTGTTIQSGVEVMQVPARVTVTGTVKVTLTGGEYDHEYNGYQEEYSSDVLTDAATYDTLVEGEGDWAILIEPLKDGSTLEMTGSGPYVTDFFSLPAATIVHVVMDATSLDDLWAASLYLSVGHQYENLDVWTDDTVVGDSLFSAPYKLEGDAIVKPTGDRTQYYWIIDVPIGTEWSITVK